MRMNQARINKRDLRLGLLIAVSLTSCDGEGEKVAPTCNNESFSSVAAGKNIACAVDADGCVSCWGNEGLESTEAGGDWQDIGDAVPPEGSFSKVAVDLGNDGFDEGGFTSCGITTAKEVKCWGKRLAETGVSHTEALDLSVAGEVCGIGLQGGVLCWGAGSSEERSPPGGRWLDVDSSSTALVNCAVRIDAEIRCWGYCDDVMCTPPEGTFVVLDLGTDWGCALDTDGMALCWGGYQGTAESPAAEERFSQISVGSAACGVRRDSTLLCWGDAEGTAILSPPPGSFTQVDVGVGYACAVSVAGDLYCWGDAPHGQDKIPG